MGHIAKQTSATTVRVDGPPPLTPFTKAAIETPMVSVMGEHGFDLKPGFWKPPAVVSAEMASEAGAHLGFMQAVQLAPAELPTMKNWLIALGNAVASSSALTETDVNAKVSALLMLMEDYPAGVFTKASLKRAALRFKFFPAFAELAKVLDEEAKALEQKRDRLQAISSASTKAGAAKAAEEVAPLATPEQQAAVRAMLGGIGIGLKRQMGDPNARAAAEEATP